MKISIIPPDELSVERRKESRLKANQPVTVTAMGMIGIPPTLGQVLDRSGSGLRLRTPNPMPCGSPVKVESGRLVMLAEVCRCESDGDSFIVGLTMMRSAS
ncbi:MAG: PilZ domain-containing protein [Bryobacteraceae bacterium]